ncbi:MAG: gamma-glutamyltransferase, partial [Acidimicrobiia bacterium]|nr:gamma-glutamyltransferase [Acidimicrobiia bacterium]
MPKVMTAAGSTISAEAAAVVADAGGNAVDAALAAVIVSMCTEPGIIAPAAGAFITVWEPGQDPVTIDAYCEMPGRADPDRIGTGRNEVFMTYGGGMRTNIGYSSVATPGAFAGFDIASSRYGAVPWAEIFGPAIQNTREGFPLPGVTARYWEHSHEVIFGWHPASYPLVHHPDGTVRAQGEILAIPELASSLELIAKGGAEVFYTGEIGTAIADELHEHGGILSRADMAAYEAVVRQPIRLRLQNWDIATNPVPAIGGAALAGLLMLVGDQGLDGWTAPEIQRLVDAQRAIFTYRGAHLESADEDLP